MSSSPLRTRSRGGFSRPLLSSILAGALLVILIVGGLIAAVRVMHQRKEETIYKQTIHDYKAAKTTRKKVDALNRYLALYPTGKHAVHVRDLIDQADRQRGYDLVLEPSIRLRSGRTLPFAGRLQLLRADIPYDEILRRLKKDARIAKLMSAAAKDPGARLELFDAYGRYLEKLKARVVREGVPKNGKLRFSHLPAGEYLLYGVAAAGANVLGIFDRIRLEGERADTFEPAFYAAYARDAERRVALPDGDGNGGPAKHTR